MPSDEFLAANRRNWDERVPIHRRDRTGFYAVERFLAGEKQLHAIELGELGDVAGKRLIHLQCHFDIAFVTWGTICWLPDLAGWAQTIASLLAPDGYLYFADAHPNMLILEEKDGRLVHEYPIDTPADRPLVFDQTHTYSDDATPLAATRTYQWIHSLSRIVGALLDAGLTLDFLHEHPGLSWPAFPMCVRSEDGMWRLPDNIPAFPLSVSLRARKSS